MKQVIIDVLEKLKEANLYSESAREVIADAIVEELNKLNSKEYYYSRDLMHAKTNSNSAHDYGCTNEAYEKFLDEYEGGHFLAKIFKLEELG